MARIEYLVEEEEATRSGGLRAAVLAVVAAGPLALALARGPNPSEGTLVAALGVACLGAELRAVPLPGFGFFSVAFAGYFALLLLPGGGLRAAAAVGLAGVGLRTLLRGHPEGTWRVREATADLFPLAAALGGAWLAQRAGLPPAGPGLALYCLGALTVPGLLAAELPEEGPMAWGAVAERLGSQRVAVGFAGWVAALLMGLSPWLGLAVAPFLYAAHRAALTALFRLEGLDRGRLERDLSQVQERLIAEGREHLQTRRDLRLKVEEFALLEELAASLPGTSGFERTVEQVLHRAGRLVRAQSVVVFVDRGEGLVPGGYRSPHGEKLADYRLLGVAEPVVERAWRERQPCRAGSGELGGPRLFEGEQAALALPLQEVGVLYVGAPEPDAFGDEEFRLLTLLASQAGTALQSALHQEAQQEALRRQREAVERLEALVGQLARVLEGVRELVAIVEPERCLRRLGEICAAIAPHQVRVLQAGERCRVEVGEPDRGSVEEIARAVMEFRRPLLLEEVEGSRFRPPAEGVRSVLAVPMNTEEGPLGFVLLGSREEPFRREQQDLVFVLAYQAAAAFSNAQLHRRLRESQAQLVQSSKLAAVGQLAAGVAHEINTPLGAILLAVDSALGVLETRPERAASRLERARKAALQAREIVSKLLFYSRDARRGRRLVDLAQVAKDTLELIGKQFRDGDVQVEVDLDGLPPVEANQSELQQVLTNLLLNARDALVESGARCRRVTVRGRPEGEAVVLEVEDRGPGIPPEVCERIFEPFFTTKPVGRGTGLGLSVSREIAEQHGGELSVRSRPGEGTVFTLRLPVRSEEGGAGGRAPSEEES